jgi:TPR repeat protein
MDALIQAIEADQAQDMQRSLSEDAVVVEMDAIIQNDEVLKRKREATEKSVKKHRLSEYASELGKLAREYDKARTALVSDFRNRREKLVTTYADKGDPDALYKRGEIFLEAKDKKNALGMFEKALEKHNMKALDKIAELCSDSGISIAHKHVTTDDDNGVLAFNLAEYYLNKNKYVLGRRFLKLASNKNHGPALHKLADIHYYGEKIPRDHVVARSLYMKAVQIGYEESISSLAYMLKVGEGGDKDLVEAARLYQLVADKRNDPEAYFQLGHIYETTEDHVRSFENYLKAHEGGYKPATNSLGVMYLYGYGVEKDVSTAKNLFEKVANEDHDAAHNLAVIYREGNGVSVDPVKAKEYYELAYKISIDNEYKTDIVLQILVMAREVKGLLTEDEVKKYKELLLRLYI